MIRNFVLFTVIIVFIFIVSFSVISNFYNKKNTWLCVNGDWVKQGNPKEDTPDTPCPSQSDTKISPAVTKDLQINENPDKVVFEFYDWYISKGSVDTVENYKERSELSPEFISRMETSFNVVETKDNNTFLCTSEIPLSFQTGVSNIQEDKSIVKVENLYKDGKLIIPIEMRLLDGKWKIIGILCEQSQYIQNQANKKQIVIYFNNKKVAGNSNECGLVYGIERTITPSDDQAKDVLLHLFSGPTYSEKSKGYSSMFSEKTANILKSIKIVNRVAYINLNDIRSLMTEVSSSCGSKEFITAVDETLRNNKLADKAIFAINSSVEAFYEWIQIGCVPENYNCDNTNIL